MTGLEDIVQLEAKLNASKASHKKNFMTVVQETVILIKDHNQSSSPESWKDYLAFNVGTTMSILSQEQKKFLYLDHFSSMNSPTRMSYLAHCLVGALFASEPVNFYARLTDGKEKEICPILQDIAEELGLKVKFWQRDEQHQQRKYESTCAVFTH